jgi:Zn-dependent protease/predicted transcriptional regulator
MAAFRVARVFGIDLRLDASLAVVFLLVSVNLALGLFPAWHPDWGPGLRWGLSVVAAVAFLGSILVHELAHAVVAVALGGKVRDVTLFLFGGVARIEREPGSPGAEFLMAVAGPAMSFVLGISLSLVAAALAGPAPVDRDPSRLLASLAPVATLLAWLGPVNLFVGAFNLLPGFPLDGGRVLRALLWKISGNVHAATRLASGVGQALGWGMVATGLLMAFGVPVPLLGTGMVGGLWLGFLGWFLTRAARATYGEVLVEQLLENVPVVQLMTRDVDSVDPDTTIAALIDRHLTRVDQQVFPVVAGEHLLGFVSVADVHRVARSAWSDTPTRAIMQPLSPDLVAGPSDDAAEAWRTMARRNVTEVAVVERDTLLGLIRQRDMLRWLSIFREQLPA